LFTPTRCPSAVAAADFNQDGRLDLAVTDCAAESEGTVNVVFGNGDGTFQAVRSYSVGRGAAFVAATDLDGDGSLDLIIANKESHDASVLLGRADGSFGPARHYPVGNHPVAVVAEDFDGDGAPDLAVANANLRGTATVVRGAGAGAFHALPRYLTGT